tara:strand:- start:16842 stop:17297 length:456 start_codon:yes stop_codon:yes gene_type:complete
VVRGLLICILLLSGVCHQTVALANAASVIAEDNKKRKAVEKKAKIGYYQIDNQIVANYDNETSRGKIGWVKMRIQLQLIDKEYTQKVWNHEPLIKDIIVKEMLKQEKEQVQTAEGQEAFRQTTAQKIKERLEQETGEPLIKDMLFTQFMWY